MGQFGAMRNLFITRNLYVFCSYGGNFGNGSLIITPRSHLSFSKFMCAAVVKNFGDESRNWKLLTIEVGCASTSYFLS